MEKGKTMTNLDKIRAMDDGELQKYLHCPYDGGCIHKNEKIRCATCTIEWLNMVVEEPQKSEQQKPKVPSLIDRPNFERQLESFSIKAFVQQFKYLACKINEILTYLEDTKYEPH